MTVYFLGVKVFPNPSDGKFTIEEQGISDKEQVIQVYNVLGQEVASSNSSQGDVKALPSGGSGWAIDLSGHASGIYFYRLTDKQGRLIQSGKLILEQ